MGPLFAAFTLAAGAAAVCAAVFLYVRVRHGQTGGAALRSAVLFTLGAALGGAATVLLLAMLSKPGTRLSETWQVFAYLAALGAGICAGGVALPPLCTTINNYRSNAMARHEP